MSRVVQRGRGARGGGSGHRSQPSHLSKLCVEKQGRPAGACGALGRGRQSKAFHTSPTELKETRGAPPTPRAWVCLSVCMYGSVHVKCVNEAGSRQPSTAGQRANDREQVGSGGQSKRSSWKRGWQAEREGERESKGITSKTDGLGSGRAEQGQSAEFTGVRDSGPPRRALLGLVPFLHDVCLLQRSS